MFEWYDFFLAATAAAAVWPKIFFPAQFDPAVALAVSVASIGLAYVARPLGALVFGHLGDKYGRRSTLVWTLVLMGISSLGTAFLPPYASVGMIALVGVFVFRFLLGVGVGGEHGGAFSWVAEARPNSKHRGFWISWPNAVLALGKLLSIYAFYVVASSLSNAAYLDWGWRVPFALGAVMLLIGLIIRVKVMESPMFQQLQSKRTILKYPAFQVLREQGRKIFTLLWLNSYITAIPNLLILPYSVSYLIKLGANDAFASLSVSAGTAAAFCTVLLGAYVSDFVGRIKVLRIGALLAIAAMFPYFSLLSTVIPVLVILGQMLMYGCNNIPDGVCKAIYTESFPTKYRYSGQGLTHEIGGMVVGVLIAVVLPLILLTYGVVGAFMPIVFVCIAMTIVSLASSFFVKETRGITLE
jgi:MFS family permease